MCASEGSGSSHSAQPSTYRDVFIAHVEEDAEIALEIALGLEKAGYSTWCYEVDNVPGPSYLVQTGQRIEQAKAVVVVISPHSIGSHQVTREVVRAHECGKYFIPVRRDISHVEFQNRQPEWREAMGAASSISVTTDNVEVVTKRIIDGLEALGIHRKPKAATARIEQIHGILTELRERGILAGAARPTVPTKKTEVESIAAEAPYIKTAEKPSRLRSLNKKLVIVAAASVISGIIVAVILLNGGNTKTVSAANTEAENVKTAALAYFAEYDVWPASSDDLTPYISGTLKAKYTFDDEYGWLTSATPNPVGGWSGIAFVGARSGPSGQNGSWTASATSLPVINYFTADPTSITAGGSSTLSWSVSDATAVTIDQAIGSVDLTGTRAVSPTTTTTYTLTASNEAGSCTKTAKVTVEEPAPPTYAWYLLLEDDFRGKDILRCAFCTVLNEEQVAEQCLFGQNADFYAKSECDWIYGPPDHTAIALTILSDTDFNGFINIVATPLGDANLSCLVSAVSERLLSRLHVEVYKVRYVEDVEEVQGEWGIWLVISRIQ